MAELTYPQNHLALYTRPPDVRGSMEASAKNGHRIPHLRKTIWAKEIGVWNLASVAFGHLYDGVKLSQDRPSIAMFAPEPHVNGEWQVFLSQELEESSAAEVNPLFSRTPIYSNYFSICKYFHKNISSIK